MTGEEILAEYAAGRRNFCGADLTWANLSWVNLSGAQIGGVK